MAKIASEQDYISNAVEIFRRRVATQIGSNLDAVDDFIQFLHEWGLEIRSTEHLEKQLREAMNHGKA